MAKTKLRGSHGDHLVEKDTKINWRVKHLSKKGRVFFFLKQSLIWKFPFSPSEGHLFT